MSCVIHNLEIILAVVSQASESKDLFCNFIVWIPVQNMPDFRLEMIQILEDSEQSQNFQ